MSDSLSRLPLQPNAAAPTGEEQRPASADGRFADPAHARRASDHGQAQDSVLAGLPIRASLDNAGRALNAMFRQSRPRSMQAAEASTSTMELALLRRPSEVSTAQTFAPSTSDASTRSASPVSPSSIEQAPASMDVHIERLSTVSTDTLSDIEAQNGASHAPLRRASFAEYLGLQTVRHLLPVGAVATLSQGVAGYYMGRLCEANGDAALGAQLGMTALTLVHQIASRHHTESDPDLATRAFLGEANGSHSHTPRRIWQETQRMGALACELGAITATLMARFRPELAPLASQLAVAQVNAHVFPPLREFLSPIVNTGHVGHPDAPLPANGKNLRPGDLGWKASAAFGIAVMFFEFVTQVVALIGARVPAGPATSLGSSVAAGASHALQATLTSATEDTLTDTAKEANLRDVDPRHVRWTRFSSHNPLTRQQLGRQTERVEMRKFNVLVPNMLAVTTLYFMEPLLDDRWTRLFAAAAVYALSKGAVLGADLDPTVRTYQMNDVRRHHRPPEAPGGRR